ncbi:MAG: alpha/beta hydrolase [Acidimicrobiia bacterium]|nr:alpha/beta hydrolase [Acidimicrobiia bacterium]
MKRRLALCVALTAVLAACGGGASDGIPGTTSTTGGAAATTSTTPGNSITVAPFGPQDVSFATPDGLNLEGRLFPAGPTWVLLAHMRPADMASWFEFAAVLQQAGYSALAYNNRGYGNSDEGDPLDLGADAQGALAFARASGAQAVFFIGASMNGAAALFLAAEEDLAGIVTLSGVPEWDNTPGLSRAGEITEPALFVAARDDGQAAAIADAMGASVAGNAQVIVYPTGGHGTAMFTANPGLTDLLLGFVAAGS